jgi:serine/threonine protein kinase/Tfp pilus assembly protein PilF
MPGMLTSDATQMATENERGPPSTEVSSRETEVDPQFSACAKDGNQYDSALQSSNTVLAMGQLLSGRYRIERELGEGGMGVVYLAADEQVPGERFAIKVLKEELHPEALAMLREEVRKTRKLSHPNIVDVHSVNVDGQKLYLLMEYLEGKSLDKLLDEEFGRGMSFSHAWPIIEDVGAALGNAHDHNVIHSDLKPANVFLTNSGRTKLLDFGIARVSRGPLPHAPSGTRALTPGYASCGMLEGKEADRRDDIYSFACVIYEMLCGERPFGELNALEAREAGTKVPPLQGLSRGQNAALAQALAFDRDRRTSSVEKLIDAVAADHKPRRRGIVLLGIAIIATLVAAGLTYLALDKLWVSRHSVAVVADDAIHLNPALGAKSIAVLPLTNESGEASQQYFSDGISEDLITALSQFPGLKVIGRTSAFQFRDSKEDSRSIGVKLGVAHLLEGSVRRSGEMVRVSAELIDTADGSTQWSERYDRPYKGLFALQDEITLAVAQALKVKLLANSLPARQAPGNQEAYNLYLQGRFLAGLHTKEGFAEAIDYLERAIKLDPSYEPLWTELSIVYANMKARGFMPSAEAFPKAHDAVREALKLNPKSARAYVALGYLHMTDDWDWAAADREIGEAFTLEPGSADVLHAAGTLDLVLGRVSESVRMFLLALERDPLRASSYSNLGVAYLTDGRLAEAEQAFRKSIQMRPAAGYTHNGLGLVLLWKGELSAALGEMKQETDEAWRLEGQALVYWAMHRRVESDKALAELIAKFQKQSPYVIATVYGYRGEANPAFQLLEHALSERDATLTSIKADPLFSKIRSDPRYATLLQRAGLPL